MSGGRTSSLARHLLCAVPQLQDPNFKRSVVLMLEHNADGAFGLVLNNELPNTISEVAEGLGLTWNGEPDAKVRLGGPVEPMRGWILHDQAQWDPQSHEILPGIQLTTSLDPITRAGRTEIGQNDQRFVILLGYAGWDERQLEGEIAAGSWVAVPIDVGAQDVTEPVLGIDPHWILEADPECMWDEALKSIGVDPGRLVGLKGGDAALH